MSDKGLLVDDVVRVAHATALEKGWWPEGGRNDFECMALIHSEVTECVEDLRDGKREMTFDDNGKPCGLPSELADIVIRVADYCGKNNINLEHAIAMKLAYNKSRPFRHGGKLA